LLAACVFACGACGTVYRPATSPRIELVVHGGGVRYLKEGNETAVGPFGGDLESLVAGDPEALRYARRARRELAVGVPTYVVGVAAVVVGMFLGKSAGWVTTGAGAAAMGVGLGLLGAGAANTVDAVNRYNDHVAPWPP
jgi:intracellular sulfur oxidation DsrE/DsrF family protein